MKKIINIVLRILLSLLLVMPILGVLGVFPAPTRDLYQTQEAYDFIITLSNSGYIMWMMAAVFAICLILTLKNKMAAVALLLLPITLNIIGFHTFLDGGLLAYGSIMAIAFFLINLYFLWENRNRYKVLF
ncbi:MAG: hypothetical protein QG609_487 [Patescibacteria group bacterium]|nr:hypothetical protein [Patescibacteria group bacterium]